MSPTAQHSIFARDLMHKQLIRLDADASLARAVETLTDARISGAPVIDASERLVGVFTLRDAARSEVETGTRYGASEGGNSLPDWGEEDLEDGLEVERNISMLEGYSPANGGNECVGAWMNPSVISVTPDADLRELCQVMAREKIHRVFVVDGRRLVGVVSALDVVAHVAKSAT